MTAPFISIIVPTYNAEKTLRMCIDSVVSQSYRQKEIWIVDNQSDDSTISIINEYVTLYSYIKYISGKDRGIYDAMNKGIGVANGRWLYFLGSDDTLHDKNVLTAI
ncbi:MAG: glycosyltransferase, partial [Mucilaginibacter sp.]|nr:glycosyltransferase [Mucilaginibacter sp.]